MNDTDRAGILDEAPEEDAAEGGALESLIDGIEGSGEGGSVSVGDVLDRFKHRSVGALVSVFAFLAALPIVGGIPGTSVATATLILLILLILGQSLVHKHGGIWVPDFLARRRIRRQTLEKGAEKARPYGRRVDRWLRPRLVSYGRP